LKSRRHGAQSKQEMITQRAHALMAKQFTERIGQLEGTEPRLAAAMKDLLSRPGSLVRAVTAYMLGIVMGLSEEAAECLGCGIEYLHTASLVFDDLPSMDNALLRRGAPSLHTAHGEAVSILAALALVNRGYSLLWKGINDAAPARRLEASEWIESKLGIHGVLGGQAWDIHGSSESSSTADVSRIAARKTADLLRLTLVLPAIVGQGTRREITLLDRLALLRGVAYQAADDLKDAFATETQSGKSGGRDQELQRPNLLSSEGADGAKIRCRRLIAIGDRVMGKLPGPASRWSMLENLRVAAPASTT
jgi:geranylgeranyl pyrophosphate synthase